MLYRLVFITCLGAVLEFLDFAIVMLFASELSKVFLPDSGNTGLLWIFAIYSMGHLSRPLGGILFSHFGDRVGLKQLFRLSIIMMSMATLGIGLLPGYGSIGVMATISLAGLRALQGCLWEENCPGRLFFPQNMFLPGTGAC